jgi:hypothetical protein
MKRHSKWSASVLALAGSLVLVNPAWGDATISTFDNFTSGAMYASWASATIVSGPTSYDITATGYGSNWKYIGDLGINGVGNTHLALTISLSGPPAADGQLGPIITLVDGDESRYNFAWYGQTLGSQVLTKAVDSPTWIDNPGTTPGLNLATLTHMHMQLDPGGFGTSGAYTVSWQDLRLTLIPEPSTFALVGIGAVGLLLRRRQP